MGRALHCITKKTNKRERQYPKQVVWKIKRKYIDPDPKVEMHARITRGKRNSACIKSKILTNVCNACTCVLFEDAVPRYIILENNRENAGGEDSTKTTQETRTMTKNM